MSIPGVSCRTICFSLALYETLTKVNPRIETSTCTEKIESRLSVIALAGLVDFCLGQDNQGGAGVIPLQLDFVTFEKILLRSRRGELGHIEKLDSCWQTLNDT